MFVYPDDGGHAVWLPHDLQAAKRIISPAAWKQELQTGGAEMATLDLVLLQ